MESKLQEQISVLYDERAPGEAKLVAADAVVEAGTAAIPLLIDRLGQPENPTFLDAMKVATGPMHAGPPTVLPVTVKFQIESMLYQIIDPEKAPAPADASRLGSLIDRGALDRSRPPLAFVKDWPAWWTAHQGESLDEMRQSAREELDRLWDEINAQTTAPPR